MNFLIHHWFLVLAIAFFFLLLIVLFIGGILKSAGDADAATQAPETPCSWCQREQAIKAQPHESHGICERHSREMLQQAKQMNQTH